MSGTIARLGGRRLIAALGGFYLASAAGWPLLVPGRQPLAHIEVLAILVGGSGLVLLATGYRLPRTDIRPDLFPTVARWCFGAIGVILGVLILVALLAELNSIVKNVLILTSLSSVAGLGIGFHDAKAKTRARNAVERRREAERYGRELERQNERLESFASMLAHELRNPVAIGQIYAQQLSADGELETVEYVTEAFDRIEDMVDVMLVLARGQEVVEKDTTVELAEIARETWDELDASDATVAVELDAAVKADETYVRHLFRNLFENAVEHGGPGVTVTVGELPTGFYVADDGVGIPSGDWDAVFDVGYTTAAGNGGTGLGLAFVRELADVYEWTCTVTEGAAGGSQFEFTDVTTMRRVTE